jgi:hypothetical protein
MAPTLVASSDDMDSVLRHIRQGKVRPVRKYIPVSVMVKWAKDRMTTSYMDVISYVNHNYPGPKAWAAKKLLRSFVFSRRMKPWMGLAYFGLGMSVVYSAFRALTL